MTKDIELFSAPDTSLRQKVFQYIKSQIINGVYSAGDILLETKLAQELGVSRTPIREAIWLLEVEGLVETTAKKGAIVLGISDRDVADICVMRQLLEGLAARWATPRLTDLELKELQKIVDLTEFYAQKDNIEEIAVLDNKFHQTIYEASGSKMLNLTLSNFHKYIQVARLQSMHVENRLSQTITEHLTLLEAFRSQDADAAEKAMTYHVSMVHRNISSLYH
jgi:DNA-binding GntR family transcriptional regulator